LGKASQMKNPRRLKIFEKITTSDEDDE